MIKHLCEGLIYYCTLIQLFKYLKKLYNFLVSVKSEQLTVHLKNPKVYIKWQAYLVFPLLLFLLQGLLEALC